MGCWNGTCMISNLPIFDGDKVKLVFLYNPYVSKDFSLANSGGFCYSTDLLKPAFFPINAEYNDYGSVENIEQDWAYDLIMQILKDKYSLIEVEKKEISDWTLDEFIRGIERGSLKLEEKNDILRLSPFSFTMIRKDIWDGVVKSQWNSMEYWNDETKSENDYYINAETFIERKITNFLNRQEELKKIFEGKSRDFSHLIGNDLFDFESKLFDNQKHVNYFTENISNNKQIVKDFIELTIIRSFLESTRKAWMIQPGAGSQTSDTKPYIELAKLMLEVCDSIEKRWDD